MCLDNEFPSEYNVVENRLLGELLDQTEYTEEIGFYDLLNSPFTEGIFNDILGEAEEKPSIDEDVTMDLEFGGKKVMWLYRVSDYSDKEIEKDKNLLLRYGALLYESLNTAMRIGRKTGLSRYTVRCAVDITNCLDLVNSHDIGQLKAYYEWAMKNQQIKANVSDEELIGKLPGNTQKLK